MRSGLFNLALWTFLALTSSTGHEQSATRLTGVVKDPVSSPVAGATITLLSPERVLQTTSADDGSFEFNNINAGIYRIEVSAKGFVKQKLSSIDLRNNAALPLSIALQVGNMPDMETCGPHYLITYGAPGTKAPRLSGLIRDFYGNKPVANVEINAWPTRKSHAALKSRSDRAGKFSFENLSAGYYDLQISRQGFWPMNVKELVIPRENAAVIEATVLRRNQIVICQ